MARRDPRESLRRFAKKIDGIIKESGSIMIMNELANELIKIVKRRTRLGKGIKGTQARIKSMNPSSLPKLSSKYKKFRKDHTEALSSTTAPSKANNTLSGQMIEALVKDDVRQGGFTLKVDDTKRKPIDIKTKKGIRQIKTDLTNAELSFAVVKRNPARRWVGMTYAEYLQIIRYFRRLFGDLVRRQRVK